MTLFHEEMLTCDYPISELFEILLGSQENRIFGRFLEFYHKKYIKTVRYIINFIWRSNFLKTFGTTTVFRAVF